MSNNTPDYENDLVFPPASADVHTAAIERCEKLEKQLEIAKKCLKEYAVFKCKDSWFAETALEQIKELDR